MQKDVFLRIFHLVAILEGLSFIVLLFFAMPMKYFYNEPAFVSKIGMLHGLLFILFVLLIFYASQIENLRISTRQQLLLLLSSILPFGPFVADKKIIKTLR